MDKIVLGIGNPGNKYAKTRHNLGFAVVDEIANTHGKNFHADPRSKSVAAEIDLGDQRCLLVKPITYVNLSGEAVRLLLNWYKLSVASLLVISDDLHLPVGKIRLRSKGGSGGHRGLQSIINCLQSSDFARLRIGIGSENEVANASYVLSRFTSAEQEVIGTSVRKAGEAVVAWINHGIATAMDQYNCQD